MKRNYQRGSAHVFVVAVLVLIILGLVGWIFWKNYFNKPSDTAASSNTSVQKSKEIAQTKTFNDAAAGVSFAYPSDWSVSPMTKDGSLKVTVNDSSNKPVAYLETKLMGLGGAGSTSYTTFSTKPLSNVVGNNCALVSKVSDSSYQLYYGTSTLDACKAVGSGTMGPAFFTLDTSNDKLGTISFSNADYVSGDSVTTYSSVDVAKAFVKTSEYTHIQTMIGSLKY